MNQKTDWIPKEIFKDCMNYMPICCVDILPFNPEKTKVLLGKRNNEPLKGEYFSTGGRLLKGEEFKDCAVRKAKEELGLEISSELLLPGGTLNEIHKNSAFGDEIGYHAVVVYFGYLIQEDTKIILEDQHSDFKWFEINDPTIHPFVKERINNIIANK